MSTSATQTDTRSLSTLLQFEEVHHHQWSTRDLEDMLRHQLAAPLHLALGPLSAEVSHELRTAQARQSVSVMMTLGELLQHEEPALELLQLVKRFAKLCRKNPENPLPAEIVMFLYYVSITVALVRRNESISDLAPPSLMRGLTW